MSLLLDALKKAAEKKAQKSSQNAETQESREQADATVTVSVDESTEVDQTVSATEIELEDSANTETLLDSTEVESTEVEATALDDTQLDSTEVEATETAQTQPDVTEIEETEIDQGYVDTTAIETGGSDVTEIDALQLNVAEDTQIETTDLDQADTDLTETEVQQTRLELTGVDHDELESTELDATETVVEGTEIESTLREDTHTEIDHTELDITEIEHTDLDITDIDSTSLDDAVLDASDLDEENSQQHMDDDETAVNPILEDVEDVDDEEITRTNEEVTNLTGEDSTLLFFDENDDEFPELDEDALDQTSTETDPRYSSVRYEEPDPALTIDDVTDFMGDGLRPEDETLARDFQPGSDDTTVTNSDSLSLTSIEIDSDSLDDENRTTTDSLSGGYQDVPATAEDTISQSPEIPADDADRSTVMGTTSTVSSVDIEQLTNDETVTIKSSTETKNFAPDNYDRTLLNLSDKDVSRIFPGMKPDPGAVMTPDYAKKVFQSKSSSVKAGHYKAYLGLAFLLLLAVALWGMFEVQNEMDNIDNSLARLKHDPMPGMIKPKQSEQDQALFAMPAKVNDQARQVLAEGGQGETLSEQQADAMPNEDSKEPGSEMVTMTSSDQAPNMPAQSSDSVAAANDGATGSLEPLDGETDIATEGSGTMAMASQQSQSVPRESTTNVSSTVDDNSSRLQISSSSRDDELAQILNSAYQAYESSNLQQARELYNQAISMDPENRDALLGRAAIHVQDNELEQAIGMYQQLLLANPKDIMAMTSLISVANIEPKAGESQIKNLLRESPDSSYLHFALGNMYGSQNRWREAQGAYFDALRFNPDDPNYAYNLAVSLEHLGQATAAGSYYRQALNNQANGLAIFDASLVEQRLEVLAQ